MEHELKGLIKGKLWEYNISNDALICRNKERVVYILKNKNDQFFQEIISSLNKKCLANPELNIVYEKPKAPIPLELFHRCLRSNEVVYQQNVGLSQGKNGLFCFSNFTKHFPINHYNYDEEKTVYIDPQQVCKITRKIKTRERVQAKLGLENKRIILSCEFPWTILTIIIPTINVGDTNESRSKS